MHPDRKIGIAMGILLVGVVGALFFRNEPLEQDRALSDARERELNQRLRDRDVSVYLESNVDEELSSPEMDAHEHLEQLKAMNIAADSAPHIPVRRDGLDAAAGVDEEAVMRTEPEAVESDSSDKVATVPAEPGNPDLGKSSGEKSSAEDLGKVPGVTFVEYTVQFGDTLSGISEQFLGSQARYREIYEANKDRMSSPDRLQVGKAIRIPRTLR